MNYPSEEKMSRLNALRKVCSDSRALLEDALAALANVEAKESLSKRMEELQKEESKIIQQRWTIGTVRNLLDDVFSDAMHGTEDAIELLRDVGNEVAEFLESISKPNYSKIDDIEADDPTPEVLRTVAARSTAWPVMCSAIKDHREEFTEDYLTTIDFGSQLPFRLKRKKGNVGQPRDLRPDTRTGFAWEICCRIEAVRGRKPKRDDVVEMPWLLHQAQKTVEESDLRPTWELEAIALPPLTNNAIGQWTQVAMEYLKWHYSGNLENGKFPQIIHKRAESIHKDGPRGILTSLREILKEGIKSLSATPDITE